MKTVAIKLNLVLLSILLMASAAMAGSILSIQGQGEIVHSADARLRGMGGAGLALTDGPHGCLLNPALIGGLKWTAITFTSRPEALYVKDRNEKNVITSVRVQDFGLYLPMGRGMAIGVELNQMSDVKFKAFQDTSLYDQSYTKSITRTGGLNLVSMSLARTFGGSFSLGMRAGHVFGTTTDARQGDFQDADYQDSFVSSYMEHTGFQLSTGLALKLGQTFSLGASFTPAYDVQQNEKRFSTFTATVTEKRTLRYPPRFGIGLAYRSGSKFLCQTDALITQWSEFRINDQPISGYTDIVRLALGCEYRPVLEGSSSYLRKVQLRCGYALEPWYLKTAAGKKITGHFLTLGIGLPFGPQGSRLDASLELGMRGDVSSVGAEEKIVRGTISLWGFEPWFQRKR